MKTKMRKTLFLWVIILTITPACLLTHTISVACDVPDLIDAINAANANAAPSTLELASNCVYTLTEVNTTVTGTFNGMTYDYGEVGLPPISTPITINGHNATITRAADAPHFRIFFILYPGNLTLNDLTITNGYADGSNEKPGAGGAIFNLSTILTVNRSTLQFNSAQLEGGAIYSFGHATTYVRDSTISDNSALHHGGGIFVYHADLISIERSNIVHNSNNGIYMLTGAELVVRDSVISFNHSSDRGGGIFKMGGGANYLYLPTTISGTTFEGNTADESGGAVFIWRTPLSISDSQFLNNQSGAFGGALAYENDRADTVSIQGTTFDGDTAVLGGGAVHFDGESIGIAHSTFQHNTAGKGGAIYNGPSAISNHINRSDTTMGFDGCEITENSATTDGGGILNEGTLSVDGCFIFRNKASALGGGIHNLGELTVQATTFDHNTAVLDGGGLNNYKDATVTGSTFVGNSAAAAWRPWTGKPSSPTTPSRPTRLRMRAAASSTRDR
jgi:hypothetical protein